jgi:hypothetical protein
MEAEGHVLEEDTFGHQQCILVTYETLSILTKKQLTKTHVQQKTLLLTP